MYENYLAHYGVKGMKWGVRRRQNRALRRDIRAIKRRYSSEKDRVNSRYDTKEKNITESHKTRIAGLKKRQNAELKALDEANLPAIILGLGRNQYEAARRSLEKEHASKLIAANLTYTKAIYKNNRAREKSISELRDKRQAEIDIRKAKG